MTLVEILLVLSLLVLLASITWPALDRPIANHRLRKAADAVRVEWARARVKAMSTGATQVFRFAPDSDRYAIESQAGPEYVGDSDDAFAEQGAGSESACVLKLTERTLPEHITFVAGETAEDTRGQMLADDTQELSATESGWSDPIAFYPDGTTSTATLVLKNEHDRTIELYLRGVTGVASVGKTKSGEESLP